MCARAQLAAGTLDGLFEVGCGCPGMSMSIACRGLKGALGKPLARDLQGSGNIHSRLG